MKNDIRYTRGFTLVELSMVLVIIGLLVGSVLVGVDLINAAKIRSASGQLNQFSSATGAFLLKYQYLPGDLLESRAEIYGLTGQNPCNTPFGADQISVPPAAPGCAGNGDSSINREWPGFWYHLSRAGLISGGITGVFTDGDGVSHPMSRIGKGGVFAVDFNFGGGPAFILGVSTFANGATITINLLTPEEAFGLDRILDDGEPLKGKVVIELPPSANYPGLPPGLFSWGIGGVGGTNVPACLFGVNVATLQGSYNVANRDNLCTSFIQFPVR